jgi:hypothetical protein
MKGHCMTTKTVNYTAEQTAALVSAYTANPTKETVEAFAVKFGKTAKSVVAKLSREGVYKKAEYVSKTGEKPVKKDSVADEIGMLLGLSESDTDSLAKANKRALAAICNAIKSVKLEDRNNIS